MSPSVDGSPRQWRPGDAVVLRNCGFFVGEAWATPHVVIEDTDERVVLYRPEGARFQIWSLDAQRSIAFRQTRMQMLRLMYPGRRYAVELYFDSGTGTTPYALFGGESRFRAWKVNVEAPFRRTSQGFDTTDDFLDIIVRPDHSWYWKDEEQFQRWVHAGAYTSEDAERIYAGGRNAERLIETAQSPFDDEWTDWQPPARVRMPMLPSGWQHLPGVDITLSTGRRYDDWRRNRRALD